MHLVLWDLVIPFCLMSTLEVPFGAEGLHFIHTPKNVTVQHDHQFRYRCKVSEPKNNVIKWFYDGVQMARKGENYRINKNGTLKFTKVKVANRGWYSCGVGKMKSLPAYLTVHAPVVIHNEKSISRARQEPVGSIIHITCEAVAIPPPVIEWRVNGHLIIKNQSNPVEERKEADKMLVTLTSRLKIIVNQTANYTCSAINYPLKNLYNDTVTITITATQMPEPEVISKPKQVCVPYTGTTCRDYLQGRVVLHNESESLQEKDTALEAQFNVMPDLGLFSKYEGKSCEDAAHRLLCHMTFPDCDETNQSVPICQESCQAVKYVICFQHLAHLNRLKQAGAVLKNFGLLSLPDCLSLPSKWNGTQKCLESDHHDFSPSKVRDDCYIEEGRWYNGTVNSTKSGYTCQAWADNFPHIHHHSPLIFPELVGAENFCRNPGGEKLQPWCFTTDENYRSEICDISSCETDVISKLQEQICVPYTGTTCKDYLHGREVLHNISQSLQEKNTALEAQFRDMSDLRLFSEARGDKSCEDAARRLLCHMFFPDCDYETEQGVPICQESCQAVKSVICLHHLTELYDMEKAGKIQQNFGLLSLPDCLSLPSKWNGTQKCLESDHHDFSASKVRDDCYIEKGRWYNGTVNSTKSGYTCQAWVDNSPHIHDHSPLIFPELVGAENFCRNPGGEKSQPWCYTTNLKHRWEICDINRCETDVPKVQEQICVPFTGTTCKDYLQGRVVLLNESHSLQDKDAALETQFRIMSDHGLFSETVGSRLCEEAARRLLCHMTFPDCNNETNQAVPICQESCRAVKSVICFRHLAELEVLKQAGKVQQNIGLLSLPDCLTLPSKWNSTQKCLESDHHDFFPSKVRDDCYIEKGRWYNGTVNSTKSGYTCQAWVDNSPHKHDRSPLIFPELVGAENFCRNPGGEENQPWCYTTNAELRWEICNISSCDLEAAHDVKNSHDYEQDRENAEDLTLLYVIGACALVAICFVVGILVFLLRHCRRMEYNGGTTAQDDTDVNVESLPLNTAYHQIKSNRLNQKLETLEFPRNDIVFIEDIGQGAFGRVFKARLVSNSSISHINWEKLSSSKHSLNYDKKIKHRNPFSSKGELGSIEIHASSKRCDSKLLREEISIFGDHDRDMKYTEDKFIAIKMLKEDASDMVQADFEREASLMVEFDHVNIVRLLGVCTLGKPMCLLFEYMSKGDLNEYLRLCSPDQCLRQSNTGSIHSLMESCSLTTVDQLHIAHQVASGMVYLSEKGYVHRDLATRNCLVGSNLIVKISDFGLARSVHSMDYYHGSDKDAIPIRWMPLEAILYNKFSSQSDVWSFGVLLWEIFSFALQPYYGMTHEEVVNYLRTGNILDAPDYSPSTAYELMKSCWHRKPLSRPNFVSLHKSLSIMHEETVKLKQMNIVHL